MVEGGDQWRVITDLAERHMAQCRWKPSATARNLASGILEASKSTHPLQRLQMESCSIALIVDTLWQVSHKPLHGHPSDLASLSSRQRQRVAAVKERLRADPMHVESLTVLARDAGMSVSTLQRHFKLLTGSTIVSYIRRCRLEVARLAMLEKGLSIAEAAFLSGYSNPSNFAVAYKRAFGSAPSSLKG